MSDPLGEALAEWDRLSEGKDVRLSWPLLEVVAAARNWHTLTKRSEKIWVCHYPEFNDPYCQSGIGHAQPDKARLPRKHTQCGYYWQVPVDALTDTAEPEKITYDEARRRGLVE